MELGKRGWSEACGYVIEKGGGAREEEGGI